MTEPNRQPGESEERIIEIEIERLRPFKEHPFQVKDDKEMFLLQESIEKYVHMSPIDYVIHFRLKQAAHLLDTTENSISSIAQNTGFNNVGYFCRKFKDVYKLTPSQYRKTRR